MKNNDINTDRTIHIPNPVQVMVVQLKAGQQPLFDTALKDEKKKTDELFRIGPEGIQYRIFSLPVEAGNYFS